VGRSRGLRPRCRRRTAADRLGNDRPSEVLVIRTEVGEGSRLVELDAVHRMVLETARCGHGLSPGGGEAELVGCAAARELEVLPGLQEVVLLELVRIEQGRRSRGVDVDQLQVAVVRRGYGEGRMVRTGIRRAVGD